MGTDNLFHKRKAKSYERKPGNKPTRQRLLIVCEGSKTEPHYFKEMRHELRLKTADVTVCGEECGSDPVSVFNYAVKKFEEEDCKNSTQARSEHKDESRKTDNGNFLKPCNPKL